MTNQRANSQPCTHCPKYNHGYPHYKNEPITIEVETMVYTVQKPDVYCYVQYICCYTVACLVFKWMLIIGGTVQILVVLLNVQ